MLVMMRLLVFLVVVLIPFSGVAQDKYPLETVIQRGHLKYVTCATFSPDGKYVLTGSYDNTIKLWNRESGKEIRAFNAHIAHIRSLDFSPDGTHFVSASADNTAMVFEVITGKVKFVCEDINDNLWKAVYSKDGSKIMTSNNRDEVNVWDAQTGKKMGDYKKDYSGSVTPLFATPDGTRVFSKDSYKGVSVINLASGDEVKKLEFEKAYSMAFSPDGKYAALGSTKLFADIFDLEKGQSMHHLVADEAIKCDGCNTKITWSNDSKYLITGSKRAGINLWDAKKGSKVQTFTGYDSRIRQMKVSPDNRLLSISGDGRVVIYNLKSGKKLLDKKDKLLEYYTINFSPDSKHLILPGENNTAILVDVNNGRKARTFGGYLNKKRDDGLAFSYQDWTDAGILSYLSKKSNIALSPDGKYFVKGHIDSTALLVDIQTGKVVRAFEGHSKVVFAFDFSHDGKYLVTAGGDRYFIIWEVATGKLVRKVNAHRELIFDVKFSNDDQTIATGSWDGSLAHWDVATGKQLQYIKLGDNSPYAVDFTPDDFYLVTADLTKQLRLWEADAGEEFRSYVGHTKVVDEFDFTSDKNSIVSGSWDGKVKVFDVRSGMLIQKFDHGGPVYAVACDPQGKFIASGGAKRTIKLWNLETGKEMQTLHGHLSAVTSIKVTPDGNRLISCTTDGVIKVWDLRSNKELFTYIRIDRKEWLVKNAAGYFDGSSKALKTVNYVSGKEVINVGALFDKYYTPGLLKRINDGEEFEETGESINDIIKGSPKVKIRIHEGDQVTNADSDSLYQLRDETVILTMNIAGRDLAGYRMYNNGKIILNEPLSGKSASETVEVPLIDGTNTVSVIAFNAEQTESLPTAVQIDYDGEAALTDLYIVSIGINEYINPKYELSFAVNDAKTFTKTMSKGADTLFHKIEEYIIRDSDANKEGINKAMAQIASTAGPEDVFVFYYAGHGVMSSPGKDKEEDFYIIPYDITNLYGDRAQLESKGISAKEMMEYSRKIPAEKQLFVIDACQSGGALEAFAQRGVGREKALAQLARSTGTFYLTASQDFQYANEAGDLKHGLFTYALLEALEGKADGGSADEKITVTELKSYVEDRVPELSEKYHGNAQYPTSYSFGQDFPLVIVK